MTNEGKAVKITIHQRRERLTRPTLGEEVVVVSTIFTAPGIPPQYIQIPKDEWTEDLEEQAIIKVIKEFTQTKPITKTIKLEAEEAQAGD